MWDKLFFKGTILLITLSVLHTNANTEFIIPLLGHLSIPCSFLRWPVGGSKYWSEESQFTPSELQFFFNLCKQKTMKRAEVF